MMKLGDRFKDKTTGKIYIIKTEIGSETLCLEGENGLGRRLTGRASLNRTCEKLEDATHRKTCLKIRSPHLVDGPE